MDVRERLRQGDFNTMMVEPGPGGTKVVTLTKRGDRHIYRMRVRNLNQPDEVVVSEETREV